MALSHAMSLAVAGGLIVANPLTAQRNVPATYAITNARLVPVSGPTIEKGTLVIRDGLITAIGAAATVPADARIVDGTGLTVYPGLIDSYSSLGYPSANASDATGAAGRGGARGGGRGGAAAQTAAAGRPAGAPNSNYGVGLQPEVLAIDELDPDPTAFDAAHAAGITTALTGVANGVYRGQSALINLRNADVNDIVVKSPIAQNVGFSRGGGGFGGGGGGSSYPGSLMGVFAVLRQELLDAQHYRDLKAAYEKSPRGMRRPEYDPSLEALQPVLARQEAVIMQAGTELGNLRALDLAKEFGLRVIIAGGAEAYKVADRLKTDGVPVLLTANFPQRDAGGAGGRGGGFGGQGAGGGGAADEPEPLRVIRERLDAPKGPGLLAAAGVRFAFEAGANWTQYLTNVRRSVTAGLAPDIALKAMTVQAADIFGLSDRLGTLETGKIANLTITRGDLFDGGSRVTQLFIDGQPITIPIAPTGGGRGGVAPASRPDSSTSRDS